MRINARRLRAGCGALFRVRRPAQLPLHLHIEPTNFCNYDCIMCYHKTVISHPVHMPMIMFKNIIEQAEPEYVSLNGYGEPFLHPNFFDMVRFLTDRGIKCNTTTNGSLLAAHIDDCLQSGIELVSVSLDAGSSETYAAVRRKNNFPKILDAMRNLIHDRGNELYPRLRASFVIHRTNSKEMVRFVESMTEVGVDSLLFQPYLEIQQTSTKEALTSGLSPEEIRSDMLNAQKIARQCGLHTNLHMLLRQLNDYLDIQYKRQPNLRIMRRCVKPWISAFITADGMVRPCCSFASVPLDIGWLDAEGIVQIMEGPAMTDFRHKLKKGEPPHWLCERCVPEGFFGMLRNTSFKA